MAIGLDTALADGFVLSLVRMVIALAIVCGLAWLVLRTLARRGVASSNSKRITVRERVGVDARTSLCIIEVDGQELLVGTAEGAAPRLVKELGAREREERE